LPLVPCFISVHAQTVNRIVAVVNDAVITEADVTTHVSAMLDDPQEPQEAGSSERPQGPTGAMREAILQRLIEREVMLQEARRTDIVVAADDISERVDALRNRFESEEEFEQSLADSGLSLEQLKEQLREQAMIQRVIETAVRSTIIVSPQEVGAAVAADPQLAKPGDRIRASHLLIRVNESRTEAQARTMIDELYQQLVKGADFATLAKRYSEDLHREEGGLMDWTAQGELMPELDTTLFSLKAGELSQPIQTRLGFHLLNVEERRPAASLSLTEGHRAVYQQLFQQKFQTAFQRWLSELKRNAYIDIPNAS
jgi:parvulin-like peptidyl-prolyl isomerase